MKRERKSAELSELWQVVSSFEFDVSAFHEDVYTDCCGEHEMEGCEEYTLDELGWNRGKGERTDSSLFRDLSNARKKAAAILEDDCHLVQLFVSVSEDGTVVTLKTEKHGDDLTPSVNLAHPFSIEFEDLPLDWQNEMLDTLEVIEEFSFTIKAEIKSRKVT
jgi:hypothetical protein